MEPAVSAYAEPAYLFAPERLVVEERVDPSRAASGQARASGAGAAVMDHSPTAREQPVVVDATDRADVFRRRAFGPREFAPSGSDEDPDSCLLGRFGGGFQDWWRIEDRHAAEAEEERRLAGIEPVDQTRRRLRFAELLPSLLRSRQYPVIRLSGCQSGGAGLTAVL
jgi:hypothetical protein